MTEIINISGVQKHYGQQRVLNVEALVLHSGESLGLVGNNGAGKTTLFRCLLDLIQPDTGTASIEGLNVAKNESWKASTGSYIDESFLIDYLNPDEYFRFLGRLHGLDKTAVERFLEPYEDFFKGEIRGHKKLIRDLSKGNQKKVGIVGALMGNPKLLILDEPFANLDPSTQYQLRDHLKQLDRDTDMAMLISSHDLGHVTEFCQRIAILEAGQIVQDKPTTPETLRELEEFFTRGLKTA